LDIVDNVPGSRNGLVGSNGTGKTTIFRIITDEEETDGGEVTRAKS
jgi:ATP-binding cassette subfamily F protein 3